MSLYFLALIPSEKIKLEIRSFKEEIKNKYGVKHALKIPAHITLQKPFKMEDFNESSLIRELEIFSKTYKLFQIEISGFDRFDQQAVFADVQNKEPVRDLFMNLQKAVLPFVSIKDWQNIIHPHLTVATRDLNKKFFLKVWQEFQNRDYAACFEAHGVHLMKHNGKTWDILAYAIFRVINKA